MTPLASSPKMSAAAADSKRPRASSAGTKPKCCKKSLKGICPLGDFFTTFWLGRLSFVRTFQLFKADGVVFYVRGLVNF